MMTTAPANKYFFVDVGGVDPRKVNDYLRKIKRSFKKKHFCNTDWNPWEMEDVKMIARQKTPIGVDEKVWKGVLVGLNAMKAKSKTKATRTICLDIERVAQRLFTLPIPLDEDQAAGSVVVLNGTQCVYGRDYRITGNILNWISDRKLYKSDAIAVRFTDPTVKPPKLNVRPVSGGRIGLVDTNEVKDLDDRVALLETLRVEDFKKIYQRLAEHDSVLGSIDSDIDRIDGDVESLVNTVTTLNNHITEQTDVETEDVEAIAALPEKEDDDMIEPGVKVWHRLSGEGPWIVVQNTVLDINSRVEGGLDNAYKKSYVEVAWTVQTEDGVRDFPEVVLTTRKPKEQKMSLWKKLGIGLGVAATTAVVVHAPLILKLLGWLQ